MEDRTLVEGRSLAPHQARQESREVRQEVGSVTVDVGVGDSHKEGTEVVVEVHPIVGLVVAAADAAAVVVVAVGVVGLAGLAGQPVYSISTSLRQGNW